MPCVWSQAENVERFVHQLARKHGLAVYDPQQGRVSYPGGPRQRRASAVVDPAGDDEFAEDDDLWIPRPPSLVDLIPPVRWPLSLLAAVCCGVGAGWAWVSFGWSREAVVASVAASAWLAFAAARFALWWGLLRRTRAAPDLSRDKP